MTKPNDNQPAEQPQGLKMADTDAEAIALGRALKAEQQRDDLLAALREIEQMPWPDSQSPYALIARAAIAAAERTAQ